MIQQVHLNYLAVLVAAIVNHAIGFMWYGPLFGKQWISLMNFDKKKIAEAQKKGMKGMWKTILASFIASLAIAWVLAHSIVFAKAYLGISAVAAGIMTGFMTWLGFLATTQLNIVLWEGKPLKLYFLNTLYYFVSLIVMGMILAVWV